MRLTTAEVAGLLGVSEDFVREHAHELGGMRLPGGPRAALRFDEAEIRRVMTARRVTREPQQPQHAARRRPGPRRGHRRVDLLPLPPGAVS